MNDSWNISAGGVTMLSCDAAANVLNNSPNSDGTSSRSEHPALGTNALQKTICFQPGGQTRCDACSDESTPTMGNQRYTAAVGSFQRGRRESRRSRRGVTSRGSSSIPSPGLVGALAL
jgi:hypothetical protein